jgi:hypothetical protein
MSGVTIRGSLFHDVDEPHLTVAVDQLIDQVRLLDQCVA